MRFLSSLLQGQSYLDNPSLASNMFGKKQTRFGFHGYKSRELSISGLTDISVDNLFRPFRIYRTRGP